MTTRTPRSVATDVVHVEFELPDATHPFVGLSTIEGCEVELEEILPRRSGGYRGFYSVRGGDPERLLQKAATYEDCDARFIDRTGDGGLLELSDEGTCPAMFLAEHRAFPRRVVAADGMGRIAAELLPAVDEHDVVDAFLAAYPTAELSKYSQQSHHTPMFSHRELDKAVGELLTDRQRECLQAAYEAGYYEWPRETTSEELADMLGITPSTLTQHLRAAERKLLDLLVE